MQTARTRRRTSRSPGRFGSGTSGSTAARLASGVTSYSSSGVIWYGDWKCVNQRAASATVTSTCGTAKIHETTSAGGVTPRVGRVGGGKKAQQQHGDRGRREHAAVMDRPGFCQSLLRLRASPRVASMAAYYREREQRRDDDDVNGPPRRTGAT